MTTKGLRERLDRGESLIDILQENRLTKSAKDHARTLLAGVASGGRSAAPAKATSQANEPLVPDFEFKWAPGCDPSAPKAIASFFSSSAIETLKERMCEIGQRMWQREYTDGNGGNLTVRVGDNLALCTPTMICKGFMKPEDISLVDLDGNQLAGWRKRTSEVMTHFGIMKRMPDAKACCHAHPAYATAYAVAKLVPPSCMIPEAEVFLGPIGLAEYRTPGSPENAKVVGEAAAKGHMSILMQNHGVITWGRDIEDAYWKMENTEAYCKTIWIASQLSQQLSPIAGKQAEELVELRQRFGMKVYQSRKG